MLVAAANNLQRFQKQVVESLRALRFYDEATLTNLWHVYILNQLNHKYIFQKYYFDAFLQIENENPLKIPVILSAIPPHKSIPCL